MSSAAADRVLSLLNAVRPRGTDQWTARCPAHDDHRPSLSIRHVGDRVLVKCWIGCPAADIVTALGLTLADLFDTPPRDYKPNPDTQRKRRALEGFRQRREQELVRCAAELRTRDRRRIAINDAVASAVMSELAALDELARLYDRYSVLEHRFDVLRSGTEHQALKILLHE